MAFNSFEFSLLRAKRHADKVKQQQIVDEVRHKNDPPNKKIQFSKLLVGFIFIDCLVIQAFIMFMIFRSQDTSHLSNLVGLVGTLVAQAISLMSYNNKSKAENSSQGIVYETAMYELMNKQSEQSNKMAVDDEEDAVG